MVVGDFMYRELYNLINRYEFIYLYRHVSSDLDALGSQFGLKQMILDNFKNKQVICIGDYNEPLINQLEVTYDNNQTITSKEHLNIVLDTANYERIDGLVDGPCVKVDHHQIVDSYGFLNIEIPTASSTCEIIIDFYKENQDRMILSKQAARLLYFGLVSDSNRFMYENVSSNTLNNAGILLDTGIDKKAIYNNMYLRRQKDLEIQRFILNHYIFDQGIAYFILTKEDLEALDITREEGSNFVNVLSNVEEIKVWASITYQDDKNLYRVSLRSRDIPVEPVARKFEGGGHLYASGCRLQDLSQLPTLIQAIKEEMKNGEN